MDPMRGRRARRLILPMAGCGLAGVALVARLAQVQIVQHDYWQATAQRELSVSEQVFGHRGSILDRNGAALAVSVDTWDLYVNVQAWKQDPEGARVASETIGKALKADPGGLVRRVLALDYGDIKLGSDIDFEVGQELDRANLAGLVVVPNFRRTNPNGDVGASIVGLIGGENRGLAGIESSYNDILQGEPGVAVYERDTLGRPIPFARFVTRKPTDGRDVVLTLDRYLQQLAEARLDEAVKANRAKGGTIIIADPATGDILANATLPRMKYSDLDLDRPEALGLLKNSAVTDVYEPGSTIKAITAAAAIDAGKVTPETPYRDTGAVQIYDRELKNFEDAVWGDQTMTGVLQHSINTGAVFMARKLGPELFTAYMEAFGFGRSTGSDLPGEAEGLFPRPGYDDWTPVHFATQAYGQAISVTPFQVVQAYMALVNGGNLVTPRLVKGYISPEGLREDLPVEVKSHPIRPETSAQIRTMLNKVVDPEDNTHPGKPRVYTAGGKSGTADVSVRGTYSQQVVSFAGFAPVDQPKVVILVKLDENANGLTGTAACAPIFARLVDEVLSYMNVDPAAGRLVERR